MAPPIHKHGPALAAVATLLLGLLGSAAWYGVQQQQEQHAAQLIERESYAARNHLLRELDTQFHALRDLARFWSDYGHLPPERWEEDVPAALARYSSFERLLWSDPARGTRLATSVGADPTDLGGRPDDAEWQDLAPMLEGLAPRGGERILDRWVEPNGHLHYRVQMPARGPGASGMLVAVIDATAQLDAILRDQLPQQALAVWWDRQRIYQRASAAADIPDSWRVAGPIELPIGLNWRVEIAPTPELAGDLASPILPALLAAAWAIAILFGGLILLNHRTRERAEATERAERRYAQLNAQLENRVQERTQDLETVSQSVAHDIRGSLNVVSLNTHLLEITSDPEASRAALERIVTANRQASAVVDRLRTFSNAAFTELTRSEIDMTALARKVTRSLPAGLEVHIEPLPPCRAQPVLMEILLHNLVDNAAKLAGQASRLDIRADASRQPVVYCVADDGPGFDPGDSEAIFKPFVKLSQAPSGGQGLGLAIVARIVHRHGGSIRAESRPGEGAAFYFDFGPESVVEPAETRAEADEAVAAPAGAGGAGRADSSGNIQR